MLVDMAAVHYSWVAIWGCGESRCIDSHGACGPVQKLSGSLVPARAYPEIGGHIHRCDLGIPEGGTFLPL